MQWKQLLRTHGALFGLLFAAAVITYARSLHNDFVIWDDDSLVTLNPLTQHFTWKNILGAFSSYDPELYVPLTILSFQIEHLLFGFAPFFFHLDNLLLHIVNAGLILLLLERLGLKRTTAFFAALVFTVHPLNTEAVAWVSARKDLLAALFSLTALLSYLHWKSVQSWQWLWITLGYFFCALLSKPVAIVLPAIFLLLDWKDRGRMTRRTIVTTLPFFLLSAIFLVIGLYGKGRNIGALTLAETFLLACKSTVFAIGKFLWPTGLSPIYLQTDPISFALPQFWIPIVILILLGGMTLWSLRRTRIVMFSALFFLIFLMPSFSNFAKDDVYYFSDRYIYLSQIGLLFLLGSVIDGLRTRSLLRVFVEPGEGGRRNEESKKRNVALPILTLPILFILSWSAHAQSLLWKDSETLYRDALRKNDLSVTMHYNLAVLEHKRDNRAAAFEEYQKALAIDPQYIKALSNLAVWYKEDGQTEKALETLDLAITSDPRASEPHNTLGSILMDRGDVDGAMVEFRKAIVLDEEFAQAHINLASALGRNGLYDEGLREYKRAFELAPQLVEDYPEIKRALENL